MWISIPLRLHASSDTLEEIAHSDCHSAGVAIIGVKDKINDFLADTFGQFAPISPHNVNTF